MSRRGSPEPVQLVKKSPLRGGGGEEGRQLGLGYKKRMAQSNGPGIHHSLEDNGPIGSYLKGFEALYSIGAMT